MKHLYFLVFLLCPLSAQAEFNPSERSINGTGESLSKGKTQLGFSDLYYGLSDYTTIGVPTLSVLAGRGVFEIRRKIEIGDRWRLTPALFLGPTPYPESLRKFGFESDNASPYVQFSSDLGVDLGASRQHSLNMGLDLRVVQGVSDQGEKKHRVLGDLRPEYDYYHGGNLFYVGAQRQLPYVGYTWAWKNIHLGLITSPYSYFIPLPYAYLRF